MAENGFMFLIYFDFFAICVTIFVLQYEKHYFVIKLIIREALL